MSEMQPEPTPYAIPMQDVAREEFEKWRFNIDEILMEKEYNLLGYFWDKTAKNKDGTLGSWIQKGEPRVNEAGAKAIITAMGGVINKVSMLTQLNIDEILMETRTLAINLNRLFFLHHVEYNIKSPTDGQALLWDVIWFAFNGLKQSEGAAAMKSLAEAGQTIRHVYTETAPAKGGGLLHLPGRKSG